VPTRRKTEKETFMTIAVGGEGVTPKDLSLRQLAELLQAMATTIEAVAAENAVQAPRFSLAKVQNGSAALRLVSDDEQAPMVRKSVLAAVRTRGRLNSPPTRSALLRLHKTAAKTGPLRIESEEAGKKSKPIFLSVPVEIPETFVEDVTVVFGRIVGVRVVGTDEGKVMIRYDDGGTGEFEADPEMLTRAANLIGRHAACHVTIHRSEQHDMEGRLEDVEEQAQEADLMAELDRVREQLIARGVVVDAEAWRREEQGEEEHREGKQQ